MADRIANEHSITEYGAILKDEADVVIAAASLTTLTLTLYNLKDGAIINSRDAQNVLNANNVTVDSSGNLVWTLQAGDNAQVEATPTELEKHMALFEFTWASGAKRSNHEVPLFVRQITKVAVL